MDPSIKITAGAQSVSDIFDRMIDRLDAMNSRLDAMMSVLTDHDARLSLLERVVKPPPVVSVPAPMEPKADVTRSVTLPSVTKRPRRMSMHPRKAALVRFDARIGVSLSSVVVIASEASVPLATSRPSAAIPPIASVTPARADAVPFNLVRPSEEALRPLDSLFGHLVRIGSFS